MFDQLRKKLLALLRVPDVPEPPLGAPGSVKIFRAARNYYRLRLAIWTVGQAATLAGIVISLAFLAEIKNEADTLKAERRAAAAAAATPPTEPASAQPATAATEPAPKAAPTKNRRHNAKEFLKDPGNPVGRLVDRSPWWLFPVIGLLEAGGILLYLLQLPFTYAMVRLEFESHWYIVTDRSLRIRSGLVRLQEATMSFANIQQVSVTQDPLQRLLGIANVHVKSAGGGSGLEEAKGHHDSMHQGVFHGVDNATEIRDLILERLRRFRAAGLGDPDDHREAVETSAPAATAQPSASLAAAKHLLEEARALRRQLS